VDYVAREWLRWCAYGVVAALPVALVLGLLRLLLGASLSRYLPIQSDELSYWHQIATFARAGFGNGYYSYQELTPPALSAYGAWGPVFPSLYGTVLGLVGVSTVSVVRLNLVLFTVGVAGALVIARPDARRLVVIALSLLTFTPMLLFLPSGMQEPLHLALAVALAALFHRLLHDGPAARRTHAVRLVGLIVLAALLRPTWGLLLIPVALAATIGWPGRRRLWAFGGAAGAALALGVLFSVWSAPYPYLAVGRLRNAASVSARLDVVRHNVWRNLSLLVAPKDRLLQTNVAQHYVVLTVMVVLTGLIAWALRTRTPGLALTAGIAGLAVALPLGLVTVLYDMFPGTRVLAAHLLFAVVLLGLSPSRPALAVPVLVMVSFLVALPWFHRDFVAWDGTNFRGDRRTVAAFHREVAEALVYRPGADRWCNTVLAATDSRFFYQLLGIPAGFGVSVDLDHEFTGPLRSAYVIATDRVVPHLPGRGAGLEPIVHTRQGTLYRNRNSPCFQGSGPPSSPVDTTSSGGGSRHR
jgi:hypothetical protein